MMSSLLDILCSTAARKGQHLYQADEGGTIRISWEHAGARPAGGHDDTDSPRESYADRRALVGDGVMRDASIQGWSSADSAR